MWPKEESSKLRSARHGVDSGHARLAKLSRTWAVCIILACAIVLSAQRFVGRWELIDYGPEQIALWLTANSRMTNPNAKNAYDREGLPLMSVQCLNDQPRFFINVQFELPGKRLAVTYRLDDGKPVNAVWKIEDSQITIAPEDMEGFVQSMQGKQKLMFTLEFPNAPTTTTFEIVHLDEAMRPLTSRCKWTK